MTRSELILFLNSIYISNDRYSFDKIKKSDCLSLLYEKQKWNIYYTERDKPELIASFENEQDANLFIAHDFKRQI
ncbi:hypothetical protein [Acinetobacter portensis]|uniref:hypothetical protein n=1 Tax=Acinetobacter portensis TaxID=1839785 RepID=UPI0013D68108|nr:hypothetical protein [Acinetobacter portensis]